MELNTLRSWKVAGRLVSPIGTIRTFANGGGGLITCGLPFMFPPEQIPPGQFWICEGCLPWLLSALADWEEAPFDFGGATGSAAGFFASGL